MGERLTVVTSPVRNVRKGGPLNASPPGTKPGEPLSATNHKTGAVLPLLRPPPSAEAAAAGVPSWLLPAAVLLAGGDAASALLDPSLPALLAAGAMGLAGSAAAGNGLLLPRLKQLPEPAVRGGQERRTPKRIQSGRRSPVEPLPREAAGLRDGTRAQKLGQAWGGGTEGGRAEPLRTAALPTKAWGPCLLLRLRRPQVRVEYSRQQLLGQYSALSAKAAAVLAEAAEDVRFVARLCQLQNKMQAITGAAVTGVAGAAAAASRPAVAAAGEAGGEAAPATSSATASSAASSVASFSNTGYEARISRVARARAGIEDRLAKRVELLDGYGRVLNMIEVRVALERLTWREDGMEGGRDARRARAAPRPARHPPL